MPDDAGVIKVIKAMDLTPGMHWLTVYKLGNGWAAVEMWINNEHTDAPEDFPEPWQTGIGRYTTKAEAIEEMKHWALSDELPIQSEALEAP